MSINDGLVAVFEARKSGQIKSWDWETPKTQKGNYIFITQHILIQFIKRAEYASRSPFLSKKRYKVTIKLEMCDISWNCSVYIGSVGKGETDKWKRHTNYSKSNKSGRHSIWGPRLVVFRYIYTGRITKIGCCVRACHIFVAFFCVQPGKLYAFFEGGFTLSLVHLLILYRR